METLYRLSYWGGSGKVSPPCGAVRRLHGSLMVMKSGIPYDSSVSTVSSRSPLACAVLACSHASRRSSDSGREIR